LRVERLGAASIQLAPLTSKIAVGVQGKFSALEKKYGIILGEAAPLVKEIAETTRIFLGPLIGTRWGAYLGVDEATRQVVGTCSFKGAPNTLGEVEIAYYTFPPFEGKGYASAMAERLVEIAFEAAEVNVITAHTLAKENASTSILKKLGFTFDRQVSDPDDGEVWKWIRRRR